MLCISISYVKRATLLLDDAIYRRAKALGRERGKTLKETLNELLRFALNAMSSRKTRALKIPLHKGSGPVGSIDIADRNSLYDLLGDD